MKNNCNSFIAAIDAVFGVWNHGKKSVVCVLQLKNCFPWQFFSWNHMKIHKMMNPMHHWCYGMSQSPNYYNYNSKTVHQLVCDLDRNFFLREIADIMTIIVVDKKIFLRWIVCVHSGLVKANKKGYNNNKKIIKNQLTSLQEITQTKYV